MPLVRIRDGDAKPAMRFVELESKEGAALALDREHLIECGALEVLTELDYERVRVPLQLADAGRKPCITGTLLAPP